jgi:pimeloyl-ACP methyl ester carboxylesterase
MSEIYEPRRPPVHEQIVLRGLRHHLTRWPGERDEPLVLLHGWLDSSDTFQFLVDAMSDRHAFAAPDWRGFGRTEWPADGYWFPDYLGDLDALLDQLSPGVPVTLAGHSMGGNIAMLFAGVRPERVHRVVCIEGFGLPRTHSEEAPGRYREWLRQLREPPEFAHFPSLEAFAHLLSRRNPRLRPDRARFIARAWTTPAPDGGLRMLADPAHKRLNAVLYRREEAEACWREIIAPVLYVVAGQSEALARVGPDARYESMASLVRRLESCRIEDASHMVHHERPVELAHAIEAFLDRHP